MAKYLSLGGGTLKRKKRVSSKKHKSRKKKQRSESRRIRVNRSA